MKYLGLDGCKAGWFLIGFDDDNDASFRILKHISELDEHLDSAEIILIDIPVGLRSKHPDERKCDKLARKMLGQPRGSSVFPAPSRLVLDITDYREASRLNKEFTGRGLSQQSFNIIPKIREVDQYLQSCKKKTIIHEMHPEICLWAMNCQKPMLYKKRKTEGCKERIAVLNKYHEEAGNMVKLAMKEYRRLDVARDDIVDALTGAIAARNSDRLQRIPEVIELDEKGLPMEIVYWLPSN